MLVDLDGVVRLWPATASLNEAAPGVTEQAIHTVAFSSDLLDAVVTGRLDDSTWRRRVADRLAQDYGRERADAAVAAWSAPVGQVNREALAVLDAVTPDIPVVLVTNATTRLDGDLRGLGLGQRFAAVVNSSDVGLAKPDAALFHHAVRVAGVAAHQALFIDDTPANVLAAQTLGIRAHLFSDAPGPRQFLAAEGALHS